jgi:hypothetical protein
MQYESAGKRRDRTISREGKVALRRALMDLGIGLVADDPAAKAYAARLKSRGTRGISACALAHRVTRVALRWCMTTPPTTPRAGSNPTVSRVHETVTRSAMPSTGRNRLWGAGQLRRALTASNGDWSRLRHPPVVGDRAVAGRRRVCRAYLPWMPCFWRAAVTAKVAFADDD